MVTRKQTTSDKARRKLIVVGGGKGGVGKSIGTQAIVDTLLYSGQDETDPDSVFVLETDTSNPDVSKVYLKFGSDDDQRSRTRVTGAPIVREIALDDENGFIETGNIIEGLDRTTNRYVVINSAARATHNFVQYESILRDVATHCGMECVMLWFINRQRDSLELLADWMDAVKDEAWTTSVVKNTYFGNADKFTRFDTGKLKNRVHAVATFPELNDLVADKLVDERLGLWNADNRLTIAERSALARFRSEARKALAGVI